MDSITLTHHGIIGMKWGRRRYQNKDGSLTPEGRKRYGDGPGDGGRSGKPRGASNRPKSIKEMSDEEINEAISRMRLEKTYAELVNEAAMSKLNYDEKRLKVEKNVRDLQRELHPPKVSKGKEFVDTLMEKAIKPAAADLAKDVAGKVGKAISKKILGDDADDAMSTLKKTAEIMGYKSKIAAAESVIRKNEDAKRAAKADKKASSDSDSDSKPKSDKPDQEFKPKADEPEIIIPTKVVEKDYNSPSSTYSVAAQRFMMEERIANRKIIEADDTNPQLSVAARRLIAGVSDTKLDE